MAKENQREISQHCHMIYNVDNITERQCFIFPLNEGLESKFIYDPSCSSNSDFVSGYITIEPRDDFEIITPTNTVIIEFFCGNAYQNQCYDLKQMKEKNGFKHLFQKAHVKIHKLIGIKVAIHYGKCSKQKMHHDLLMTMSLYKKKHDKLISLYELMKKNGDIILKRDESKNNDDFNDNCESKTTRVYKSMLINESDVFSAMFNHDSQESQSGIIKIHCDNDKCIDDLAFFLVTHQLRYDANAFQLFQIAHCYQIDLLLILCLDRLTENVNEKNFVFLVNLFEDFKIQNTELTRAIFNKIHHWWEQSDFTNKINNWKCLPFTYQYMFMNKFAKKTD